MGGKKIEGRTDLDRGIDGVVDLDGRLLGRLRVCLHRRRRRRGRDARCDERERRTRLARELPLEGKWPRFQMTSLTPTTTMREGLENEEMQQIQPLLHTEEINSTSVWPLIHMIRAVCSTLLFIVFFLTDARLRMLW